MRQNSYWMRLPVLVLLAVVVWTGWRYDQLPQVMVTHWGFWGQPNGWMDKLTGAWMIPMIMVLLWALLEIMPALDRRHCQAKAFLETYWQFGQAILVMLAALQWGIFQVNLDQGFPMMRFLGWILVAFIAWLGRILPELPLNLIMGIRTRWTISSGRVWRLTHRETAKSLRTAALIGIILQVGLNQPWSLVWILVSLMGILLWGVCFSYLNRDE